MAAVLPNRDAHRKPMRPTRLLPLLGVLTLPLAAQVTTPARQPFPPPNIPATTPADSQARRGSGACCRAGFSRGRRLRTIGPAAPSGPIAEVAIHPANKSTWYVAVASGG